MSRSFHELTDTTCREEESNHGEEDPHDAAHTCLPALHATSTDRRHLSTRHAETRLARWAAGREAHSLVILLHSFTQPVAAIAAKAQARRHRRMTVVT